MSPAYESELFGDVTGKGQIRRISAYGYFLDPTAPSGECIDPYFFGGEPK